MDLKHFVAETLTQIVAGVADAQKRIAEMKVGAAVNPNSVSATSKQKIGKATPVEFDVAVTVSEDAQTRASVGASVGFLSVVTARMAAKAETADSSRNEAISRIKFSVELAQPADLTEYTWP